MKNLILSALIIASVVLTGCNKGGSSSAEYRVKNITSAKGMSTLFVYNTDNKIKSTQNSDSTKADFTYNGNTITQHAADVIHGQSMTSTLHLSAAGYVDSTTASDPSGTYLKLETHDADGYTTSSKEFMSGIMKRLTQSTFKEGNETVRTISDADSKPIVNIYFDYFTDKSNSLSAENLGMKFLGKDSKNLMKKYVQVLAKGDTVGTGTFTYKFDDKGRVIQKSAFDKAGMLADSTTFTYY